MSTKGKGRGRKTIEKTQENVVDSTTEVINGDDEKNLDLVATVKEKKQSTKRKTTKPETLVETENIEEAPVKRVRGRAKEAAIEPPAPPIEAPKKSKREVKNVDAKIAQEKSDKEKEEPPKRGGKGRTKAAQKEEVEIIPKDTEPKTKRGTTKKSKTVESNGTEKVEAEIQAGPSQSRRGRAAKAPSAEKEASQEEANVEVEKKPKKGRATKPKAQIEENGVEAEKKPVKTAGAKKIVSGGRGRKRAAVEALETIRDDSEENDDDGEEEEIITVGKKKKEITKETSAKHEPKVNETETNYDEADFNINKKFNLKISSWNVAGIRAWVKKGGVDYIQHEQPDIICLQEIKCVPDLIPDEARIPGYHPYWLCKPGGHAGVAIYSKIMPINVEYGLGDNEQDEDGRIMTAEYEKFYLICVYVPNAGRKLVTLPKRLRWNKLFEIFVQRLNTKKPVIICGDMNVAHTEIDLTNPKTNKKNAGFTQEERDGMTEFLALGYIDTFRYFYPDVEKAYTFWSYFMNARKKNVGWRLDYFIVSEKFALKCVDNIIRSKVLGSDHCPIILLLNV